MPPLIVASIGPLEHVTPGTVASAAGTGRNHRAVHGVVVIEIHAAQLFVDVVTEGEIGGDGEIAGHLALHAKAQVLRLGGNEILHEEIAARS